MIKIVVTTISTIILLIAIAFWFKNKNAYNNQMKIMHAIYLYNMNEIENGVRVFSNISFEDMESYRATLLRFWDWGYTRILPKEKFELVKPYIQ